MATPFAASNVKRCQQTFGEKVTDAIERAEHLSHEAQEFASQASSAVEDGVRAAKGATRRLRNAALDAKTEVEYRVKREPFGSLAKAACGGAWVGLVCGIAVGCFASRRASREPSA